MFKEEDNRQEKTQKYLQEARGNIKLRSRTIHCREVREVTFKQKNKRTEWKTEKKEKRAQEHFPGLGRPSGATSYPTLPYSTFVHCSPS